MSDKLRELMVKQGPCQHSINDVRMKMVMCPKCVEALLAAQPLVVSLLERAVVDAAIACRKADLELYKSHALGTQKASVAARNKLAELTDALLATQPPAEESKNLVQRRCIYCEGYKGTIMCKHCCGTGYEPAQPLALPEREREPQVGAELREALTAASQVIANVTDEYSWKAQAIGYLVAFSEVQGIICEALAAPAQPALPSDYICPKCRRAVPENAPCPFCAPPAEPQVGAEELREALIQTNRSLLKVLRGVPQRDVDEIIAHNDVLLANAPAEPQVRAEELRELAQEADRIARRLAALAAPAESRSVERRKAAPQTSGPQCKRCGAFTTYKRVQTHGLCMKCENE